MMHDLGSDQPVLWVHFRRSDLQVPDRLCNEYVRQRRRGKDYLLNSQLDRRAKGRRQREAAKAVASFQESQRLRWEGRCGPWRWSEALKPRSLLDDMTMWAEGVVLTRGRRDSISAGERREDECRGGPWQKAEKTKAEAHGIHGISFGIAYGFLWSRQKFFCIHYYFTGFFF
jgi:hypothetical protein